MKHSLPWKGKDLGNNEDTYTKEAPHAGTCSFRPIPSLIKDAAVSQNDLTIWNMDKSHILEQVLYTYAGWLAGKSNLTTLSPMSSIASNGPLYRTRVFFSFNDVIRVYDLSPMSM